MKGAPDKQAMRDAGGVYARKEIEKNFRNSKIGDGSSSFPKFTKEELTLGKLLGKGGFGSVFEVKAFDAGGKLRRTKSSKTMMNDDDEMQEGKMESRNFIAGHCLRNNSDCRYAIKSLSQDVVDDPPTFIQGIMDMAVETRILSYISHPNIIKMRAIAEVSPYHENYFIVLDRLYDTMDKRIAKWASRTKTISGCLGRILDSSGEKRKDIYEEKLVASFDLAAAMDYLHKNNIIYRDLKPENIGFDIRNDVKLFDFGLSKELTSEHKSNDGLYNLTGMTGSPRYMAPEVGKEEHYNTTCDVYSFAVLLWQILSMKTPFELYTIRKLKSTVWSEPHKRPFMDDTWPLALKLMIQRAWSENIADRPNFGQVTQIMRNECVRCRDGDDSGLEHNRRRSTFVFSRARSQASALRNSASSRKGIPAPMLSAEDFDDLDDLSVSKRSKAEGGS